MNVRRWSEQMFGDANATLNKVAVRYGIPLHDRQDDTNHGALVDARLLTAVYPLLLVDYRKFQGSKNLDFRLDI